MRPSSSSLGQPLPWMIQSLLRVCARRGKGETFRFGGECNAGSACARNARAALHSPWRSWWWSASRAVWRASSPRWRGSRDPGADVNVTVNPLSLIVFFLPRLLCQGMDYSLTDNTTVIFGSEMEAIQIKQLRLAMPLRCRSQRARR